MRRGPLGPRPLRLSTIARDLLRRCTIEGRRAKAQRAGRMPGPLLPRRAPRIPAIRSGSQRSDPDLGDRVLGDLSGHRDRVDQILQQIDRRRRNLFIPVQVG